jgi:hypothetical protein
MVLAGATHLNDKDLQVPQPMILAATMLRIPGFDITGKTDSEQVH